MRRFLDDFLYDNRKLSGDLGIKFTEAFASAIDFALEAIGEKAFRPQNTLNSAVFDSVMIGLSERKKEQPKYNKDKIKSDYENLLKNAEYKQAYTRATADEESVKVRLKLAIGAFSDA
jgi:hypothetical protein